MTEAATIDARYVSRYAEQTIGIQVYKNGALADADSNQVDVTINRLSDTGVPTLVTNTTAEHPETGLYTVDITSAITETVGHYQVDFAYTLDTVPDAYSLHFTVGETSPDYDALSPDFKAVVENTWIRLADLYDHPFGGPHLQSYVQTHFGRNRLAQLLKIALNPLNVRAGGTNYSLGGTNFPFDKWSGLLEQSLWIEVLKHLRRSYVEQPEVSLGASVARFDRRDYMQRWGEILADEQETFKDAIDYWKMDHLGLGNVHVLVSGGAYGKWGPYVDGGGAGEAAARGYWIARRTW